MKNLDHIILITIDDERYTLYLSSIERLDINNLKRNLSFSIWQEPSEYYTCDALHLTLETDDTDRISTRTLAENGQPNNLTQRLIKYHDIQKIKLTFNDGSEWLIKVPWDFRDNNKNLAMYASVEAEFGEDLFIIFGQQPRDFFPTYHLPRLD